MPSWPRHKSVIQRTKGFRGRNKNVWSVAENKYEKSLQYAYIGRKLKKRDMREMWIQQINAATRLHGLKYSSFISGLSEAGMALDRKSLASLASTEPYSFQTIIEAVKALSPTVASAKPAALTE